MILSRFLLSTLRDIPAEAETVSHQLMLRAGMIRPVAAGIFNLLPLGLRVLRKIEKIVREELDRAGCLELLMPMVQPKELWEESGRWEVMGKELLRFADRKERHFCLGPTHEEIITDLARNEIHSYRQLPLIFYQIQTKFRDEIRPRFGLMRGREFLMKDAYSFDVSKEKALENYEMMRGVYERIFRRCGLDFRAVEAGGGTIGGKQSHEFQVLAASGEDTIVTCNACSYAANVELAEIRASLCARAPESEKEKIPPLKKVKTPGVSTIEEVASFLELKPSELIKTLIYSDGSQNVVVLLRGDHQVNEGKLQRFLGWSTLELASEESIEALTGGPLGFTGPVGLRMRIIGDWSVANTGPAVVGANEKDAHFLNAFVNRDFDVKEYADLRRAANGDPCARCKEGILRETRGIEVGQIFYLDTKYSKSFHATFLDEKGDERLMEMGCYGIGIGRTMAAAIEQHHDEKGIVWPLSIAPFEVIITELPSKDHAQVTQTAETLYRSLLGKGIDVVYDDRDERAGVKFSDADLIGIPMRMTVSSRGIARGEVECKWRHEEKGRMIPVADVIDHISGCFSK